MDDSPDDSPDAGSRENQPTTREIAAARQQQVYDPKSPRVIVYVVVLPRTETLPTKMAANHCERLRPCHAAKEESPIHPRSNVRL